VKPKIRPAVEADADFLAWVLQASARSHLEIGIWDVVFPGEERLRLETLARLTKTKQRHYAHHTCFLVAEIDGVPASALSVYESGELGSEPLNLGIVEVLLQQGRDREELLQLIESAKPYRSLGYPNPPGLWIVEWVATGPDFRGRGIIRDLLQAALAKGRHAGFERAQIGHLLGNHAARSAYEAVGFGWIDEYCHPLFEETFGSPGIARMQRDL